jgi:hypothetical protein
MSKKASRIFRGSSIFFPFLFAIYPVLALLAQNISQISPITLIRPLIFSLLFTSIVWLLSALLFRNWQKAALFTFVIQVLFFSFGHILRTARGVNGIDLILGRNRYLALIDVILLIVMAVWLFRTKARLAEVVYYTALVNIFLLIFPLAQIGRFYLVYRDPNQKKSLPIVSAQAGNDQPDIYFIILDAYARQDILASDFGFDNQPFVDKLKSMGFQVLPCSRSNYNTTAMSLSSMLNFDYLQNMGIEAASLGSSEDALIPLLKANKVRTSLEQMGYHIYAFQTGYPMLDWWQTTQTFMPQQSSPLTQTLLPIETLFIKSTGLNVLLDMGLHFDWMKTLQKSISSPYSAHIKLEQFILDKLPGMSNLTGPKFVYAHLVLPHQPYVFDAEGNIRTDIRFFTDGDPINKDFFIQGYLGQVQFANQRMIQILEELLRYSQKPPIIVLMGDHGYYWGQTHYENLVALYLPEKDGISPYASISNVNIFRLIFSNYFADAYPLLPDVSYHVDANHNTFLPVPETQPGCSN